MKLPYDPHSKDSIVEYAKKLKGHTLKNICSKEIINHAYSGKGNFGQLLEKFYFFYQPNSDACPDFPKAKMELKSSPLKIVKNKGYKSKERLVLNIINYNEIITQDFNNSSLWKKNSSLLLVFYLHELGLDVLDYIIKLVGEWQFTQSDLKIIRNDWQTIKDKITSGKAHELSEGDTYYLSACTKGSKGGSLRKQPNSPILAKQRAFSLKQGYVNHIIASLAGTENGLYGQLLSNQDCFDSFNIENKIQEKFNLLIGKTDNEIVKILGIKLNKIDKGYHSRISKEIIDRVFNVPKGRLLEDYIDEFKKAEITVRTVRLDEKNTPEEDVSFPTFKFNELIKETWEDSEFKAMLSRKFLFVFFQRVQDNLILKKIKLWNMPYEHLIEAEAVWEKTKNVVKNGSIVASIKINKSGKEIRKTNFPSKKFSTVSHVRPHAQNARDTYPLPIEDKVTHIKNYTKHSFWLNASYIRDNIYFD